MNYKVPGMKFQDPNGKLVVLKGINTYPNQVVSSHSMRSIMRHGDIEWAAECLITSQGTTIDIAHHHEDIQKILRKLKRVFGDLPHGRPPERGVFNRIELDMGTKTIKIHPYKLPKRLKDEIYKSIKELID